MMFLLNLLLTKWGLVIVVIIVALCVFVYRTVQTQRRRFQRAVEVRSRRRGDQILVLIDGRRGRPESVAHLAFRRAADPLRLTIAIAGHSGVVERYRRLQDTCMDYGGRVDSLEVASKHPVKRLHSLRVAFLRDHYRYICVLSSRLTDLRRQWDEALCRLAAREPAGTALTSFPTASSGGTVLYPTVGKSGRVRLRSMRRRLTVSMPCVALSPGLCLVSAHQQWALDGGSLTDALQSCVRFVLSPRTLAFVSDRLTRDTVLSPRGAHPSEGIVADERDDPAGYAVELRCKAIP